MCYFTKCKIEIIYFNSADYRCNETGYITDEGFVIKLKCLKDGEYEEKASWPVCREPEKCLELPPLPSSGSGLGETTSVVEKEGDEAIYTCSDPDYLVLGDQPDFRVACQKDGFFPMLSEWPECRSPDWTSTTTTTEKPLDPCQCIGDIPVPTARKILNSFCRDPELSGNYFIYNGYTPASRKRCGNRSPNKPTKTNHCYCSTVEEQGSKWSLYDILKRGQYMIKRHSQYSITESSFMFDLVLRNEPWQWTYRPGTEISYLLDPNSGMYKDYKIRIEKAVSSFTM